MSAIIFFGLQAIACTIYYLELPFLERYKVLDEPWPWKTETKEDEEEWNKLLKKTIAVNLFNQLVLVPLAFAA